MRLGEILGLCWYNVDFANKNKFIYMHNTQKLQEEAAIIFDKPCYNN